MRKRIGLFIFLFVISCMLIYACNRLLSWYNIWSDSPGSDKDSGAIFSPTPRASAPTNTPGQTPDSSENPALPADRSRGLLSKMSIDEKVGQMFIVRCPKQDAAQKAAQYHIGGYILFSGDFRDSSVDQIRSTINSYQNAVKIPLLIGVDEEGGNVNRISIHKQFRAEPFMSPQDLYKKGGFDLIISDTIEKAVFLKALGINLNLAPVCDVSTADTDYIYPRSFGKDAPLTSQYVEKVVATMNMQRIGSVLKHFPGYGNNSDTHTGIAYDDRDYDTFLKSDFLPFISGINAGAGAVLVSHNIVRSMDESYPASLSPRVNRILREDLGFDGAIMTDDLYMDAIRNYTGDSEAAVLAVLAGNDLICCTNFEEQIPAVINAVEEGVISEEQIDQSVLRILRWKLELGIVN
ncbi:MAG: glycoside hydrolase family 3 protein [Acetivibrionales bacterium]|jgi:beta-N-acetylhexosaminidase